MLTRDRNIVAELLLIIQWTEISGGLGSRKQGRKTKFTEGQATWLKIFKNYVTDSFHLDTEDFELDPFNKNGGLGKLYELFRDMYERIIDELNEVLAA